MTNKEFEVDIVFSNGQTLHLDNCSSIESVIDFSLADSLDFNVYMYIEEDSDAELVSKLEDLHNVNVNYYNIMKYVYDEGSSVYVKRMLDTVHLGDYKLSSYYVRRDGEKNYTRYIGFKKSVKK